MDYSAGTGNSSRFSVVGAVRHPDRRRQDEKLLTYTSAPLEHDLEVTGDPLVKLYVTSTATDGAFLVYLEDVDPSGEIGNVTEGLLGGQFHKVSSETPPYPQAGPYRTYRQADVMPQVPGEITELEFDLLPVSYLFKKGHSIRITLSGADKDSFSPVPAGSQPVTLQFFHGGPVHASYVDLPVMPRQP